MNDRGLLWQRHCRTLELRVSVHACVCVWCWDHWLHSLNALSPYLAIRIISVNLEGYCAFLHNKSFILKLGNVTRSSYHNLQRKKERREKGKKKEKKKWKEKRINLVFTMIKIHVITTCQIFLPLALLKECLLSYFGAGSHYLSKWI